MSVKTRTEQAKVHILRIGIGTKGLVIIIVPFLFQIAFIAVLALNLKQAEEAARESARARMISGYASAAVNLVATNTTVAAGYAFSKNKRYREYFYNTLEEVQALLKHIEALMVHPLERQKLSVFRHQVEQLTNRSADVVELTDKGLADKAALKVKDQSTDELWGRARQAGGYVSDLENQAISQVDVMLLTARQSLSQTVIGGVVIDSVLMLLLLIFFSIDITKRLSIMMDNARLFAASKPLNKQMKGSDEISQLDAVFHKMADTVIASTKREQAVVEHAADVICSLDEDGRFRAINPAARTSWGYEPQSLKGRNFLEVITPIDQVTATAAFEKAKEGAPVTFETGIVVSVSEVKDAEWVVYWSADEKALFCVVHDITERKKAEHILRENEARMRAILENMLVGVFVSDENGVIEIVNPRTEEMFGYSVKELTGMPLSKFLMSGPKNSMDVLERTKRKISELDGRRQNGEVFPVEITTSEFDTAEGKRLLTNVLDVSERREVERVRREFVAIVSHDLRTPLSGIVGGLNLLTEGVCGELPERAQEIIKVADRSASRLMSLINDLLDMEKLEAGMMKLETSPTSIEELIAQAVSDVVTLANKSGIKIVIESQNSGLALADKDRIVRVLVNLLSNAIKFSAPSSQIIVRSLTEHDYVEVSVIDSGRGIPDHFKHLLFQKFQQSQNSDATKKGGTGLGLAICKAIVEQHKGTIGVESIEGEGSRFWFRLPSVGNCLSQ